MPLEPNAHHVVNLPFMPVRRAPDAGHGGQFGFFLAHVRFHTEMAMMPVTVKMINNRPARVRAVIVNAAHVHQEIKAQFLFCKLADIRDAPGIGQLHRDFGAELHWLGDTITEPRF